jgi:transcriptional regulator with XRE-family HTH domain
MKYGTHRKLARLTKISPQSLSNYLSGYNGATAAKAYRLAKITDTDIMLWLNGLGTADARRLKYRRCVNLAVCLLTAQTKGENNASGRTERLARF